MEDYFNFVTSRYSVRSYDFDHQISKEKLMRVLETARMAPSAANRQPWKIMVIQSEILLQKLHEAYPAPWFAQANTVLVVKGYPDEAWTRNVDGYNSIETDLSILMTHIVQAAHAESLSTCWIEAFDPEKLREALGLNPDEVVFAITPLGYTPVGIKTVRPKSRKPLDEIVEWL